MFASISANAISQPRARPLLVAAPRLRRAPAARRTSRRPARSRSHAALDALGVMPDPSDDRDRPRPGAFGANPLSLSLGQSEFNQWAKRAKNQDAAPINGRNGAHGRPNASAPASSSNARDVGSRDGRVKTRYKTPYMTTDDLKKAPRAWREFLCTDHLMKSYSIPTSVDDARERLDGNVYDYVGNYARMGVIIGCAVLYRNPTAVVGAVATAKLYRWMDLNIGATSEMQGFKMVGTVLAWFVMMYTKASAALSKTVLLTAAFLLVHGCLRRRDAPKLVKIGRHTGISKWEMQSPKKKSR